jgi:Zn-dependent protease with chaperone function
MENQDKNTEKKSAFDVFIKKKPMYFVCSLIYLLLVIIGSTFITIKLSEVLMVITWTVIILFFVLSQCIVFSQFTEKMLRMFNNVRRLETADEKEVLRPLFNEVYEKAIAENPELDDYDIDIYVIDSMAINACAIGTKTVAVTKGMLKIEPQMIKAVIAHELAHIAYMDTVAKNYSLIGNGIISLNILVVKTAYGLMKKIPSIRLFVEVTEKCLTDLLLFSYS